MFPTKNKRISVIIPTINEAPHIGKLVKYIHQYGQNHLAEIIVVDANSTDSTREVAYYNGAHIISTAIASRAHQMNLGSKSATGEILYFIHADALPPKSFVNDIHKAVAGGHQFGCYRFRFNSKNPLLRVNSFFTRFKFLWCRGGDQTLFIEKKVFEQSSGFDESYVMMEDFELIKRLWNQYSFTVIPKSVIVSARKYKLNGYFKVNISNLIIFRMFQKECDPQVLKDKYYQLIKHPKDKS
ncbi:TIGR04283 family arsenosugar biosynthesis glycosyltransferase [Marivirga sp. S37H4]|uniref:TIGR04283 family arsenosugar biosynthesis glycosyltransferase n=1 Tax=Marivirga aurantiaca TaxID=2802615 RepID=A0A934WVV1_9BACT|nr:TIGR04283 family arsenosugar biosynthesis glycosyltransferase [Marivirga aurantiaca]MBK6263795.1 TIGR04283 family arsenosugar biosynthesis glycosyltransferase [Marivirga aurantiaca]